MMALEPLATDADAEWTPLEQAIERLHGAARTARDAASFFEQAWRETRRLWDPSHAAVWDFRRGEPSLQWQSTPRDAADVRARRVLAAAALQDRSPRWAADRSSAGAETAPPSGAWWVPIARDGGEGDSSAELLACLEIRFHNGVVPPPAAQEFVAALADVVADFFAYQALRNAIGDAPQTATLELLQRVWQGVDQPGAAYAAVNEGRRLVGCDRLSLLVRRGRQWRLLAVSGVDLLPAQSDLTRRLERLADRAGRWGEPGEFRGGDGSSELPPPLQEALDAHLELAQSRVVAWAPASFRPQRDDAFAEGRAAARKPSRRGGLPDAIFIAERFADAGPPLRQELVELAELCAAPLARAAQLDRFPVRLLLRAPGVRGEWLRPLAVRSLVAAAILGAAAALTFVHSEFVVEAPATLHAQVEREAFAPADGVVVEVRVEHGRQVVAGQTLAVLDDPELGLKEQALAGQIVGVTRRQEALAVARTDRVAREERRDGDDLPLAAQQQQLAQQLADLQAQRQLFAARRAQLVVRSPADGIVLTRDVQGLLVGRPVQRGQSLVTIADPQSGWRLDAELPQRRVGAVLALLGKQAPAPAKYRLAGDVEATYDAKLQSVAAAAPLDAEGLRDEPASVPATLEIVGPAPAAARPGMSATVQIPCGRRPLGYVWFSDAAATVYRWATF